MIYIVFQTTHITIGGKQIPIRTYYGAYADQDYATQQAALLPDGEVVEETLI